MAITRAQQAKQLLAQGGRIGFFKGAQADAEAGKGAMSPGTSTSGGGRDVGGSDFGQFERRTRQNQELQGKGFLGKDLGMNISHVGICSDNQSVVDMCVGDSTTDSITLRKLLANIDALCDNFESISFQWVRGHASNAYNKLADTIAYSILKG